MRTLRSRGAAVWVILALLLGFHLWLAAQIPYGVDDWSWGGTPGIPRLLSCELNNRFAGNATEILLARFPLLKTLVMGLVFTLIPAEAAALSLEADPKERSGAAAAMLLCLGAALMLTIPREVWAQSYSWVAGFSNYVVAGWMLCLYHRLLLRLTREGAASAKSVPVFAALFGFGVIMQLFLENVAVYAVVYSAFFLGRRLLRRERGSLGLSALLLGNLTGAALLFSNKLFLLLLEEGTLFGGYRTLAFSPDDHLLRIALSFLRRFLRDFSPKIWGNNWIMCSLIVLALGFFSLRRKKRGFLALDLLYLVYFPVSAFRGPLPLPGFSPIHYLSGIAEPLFFLFVAWQILAFWRDRPALRGVLLAAWIGVPLLIAPLLVVEGAGPRCYATEAVLLMQFCLLLALPLWDELGEKSRRAAVALCVAFLCGACLTLGIVYGRIGQVKRERDALLQAARAGQVERVCLPLYPHKDFLWDTEPFSRAFEEDFRDFYRIPGRVELVFGNEGA